MSNRSLQRQVKRSVQRKIATYEKDIETIRSVLIDDVERNFVQPIVTWLEACHEDGGSNIEAIMLAETSMRSHFEKILVERLTYLKKPDSVEKSTTGLLAPTESEKLTPIA